MAKLLMELKVTPDNDLNVSPASLLCKRLLTYEFKNLLRVLSFKLSRVTTISCKASNFKKDRSIELLSNLNYLTENLLLKSKPDIYSG